SLCSVTKAALEAFAALELSTAMSSSNSQLAVVDHHQQQKAISSDNTTINNNNNNNGNQLVMSTIQLLGDAACVVAERTASLCELIVKFQDSWSADKSIPPSHRKTVCCSLEEAVVAANEIRLS